MGSIASVAIFSLQKSQSISALRNELLKQNFGSAKHANIEAACRSLSSAESVATSAINRSILLVDFNTDQDKGFETITSLLSLKSVHTVPLVLIGEEADSLVTDLRKVFQVLEAVCSPCSAEAVVKAVLRAWTNYEELTETKHRKISEELNQVVSEQTQSVTKNKAAPLSSIFFSTLSDLKLIGKAIGGSSYSRTIRTDGFVKILNERDIGLAEFSEKTLLKADPQVRGHAVRLTYISLCMARALGFSEDACTVLARAALGHVAGYRLQRKYLRGELLNRGLNSFRHRFSHVIRESASQVSFQKGLAAESVVVALYSRILAEDDVTHNSTEAQSAYCLLAADIIERTCWLSGHFSSSQGRLFLRQAKEEMYGELPANIAIMAVKFIAEAIVSAPPGIATPAKFLKAYRARIHSGEAETKILEMGERQVKIEQLLPGMKLSRPLVTLDGASLLEPELKLDEDLILRIWNLAGVRPMESVIVVDEIGRQG